MALHGVRKESEANQHAYYRDTRTMGQKFSEFCASDNVIIVFVVAVVVTIYAPGVSEIIFLIAACFFWYFNTRFKSDTLPYMMPASSGRIDAHNLHPGTGKPMKANGVMYFGNEREPKTNYEIWFSNSDVRTHILVFGTTGAGKTEALLGFAYNALVQGSGFIYVDGKGDNSLWSKVYNMARKVGRDDDVLLINYMTGGTKDLRNIPIGHTPSNTVNPFATGTSSTIAELFTGLMSGGGPGSGGDDMWAGRARSFITALVRVLVWMRDRGEINMYIDEIRDHFELGKLAKLVGRKDVPDGVMAGLKNYVVNLPGMDDNTLKSLQAGRQIQSQTVYEQHGYITMQLTETMNLLADDYGHIFKTPMGEIDFFDVVANRRILIVLLPALEKSPASLSNLGKIIVAGMKSMMASSLGSEVEGNKATLTDVKPTNSPTPYITILDEYGYYAVEGSAVMPAQARALGFCMIFAGQDYPAFKKASEEEAASIVANTKIKICMALEDPKETFDIFSQAAGKAIVTQVGGFQQNIGLSINYNDIGTASPETKDRINIRDLKDQGEGEAHILYKDRLCRMKTFYTAASESENVYANSFLCVPVILEGDEKNKIVLKEELLDLINGKNKERLTVPPVLIGKETIEMVSDSMRKAESSVTNVVEASIFALGEYHIFVEEMAKEMANVFSSKSRGERPDSGLDIAGDGDSPVSEGRARRSRGKTLLDDVRRASEESNAETDNREERDEVFRGKSSIDNDTKIHEEINESRSGSSNSGVTEESKLLDDIGLDDESIMSDLSAIDRLAGISSSKSEENAKRTASRIEQEVKSYKVDPEPEKRPEVADDILSDLEDMFSDDEDEY